jgi:hypothetical protein
MKLEAFWAYYIRFISGFANIAKRLFKLREQKQSFQWTEELEAAFQTLKGSPCAIPILAYPQPGEKFIMDTEASNVGIGGVLFQVPDGQESVIAYCSKALNKSERNYCVTRRELLATLRELEQFHEYVYGKEFHLCTDHSSLTRILSFKNVEGQSSRWIQHL